MERQPAVAGRFYPGDSDQLGREILALIGERSPSPALGVVSPHAGYAYSGSVAGAVFSRVEVPDLCVILAPNHTGMGRADLSVWPDGEWLMPMGGVPVDAAFCRSLIETSALCEADVKAHRSEHSVEVQIPFLHAANPSVRIVPVIVSSQDLQDLQQFGRDLARVIADSGRDVLVVASSDMTHYESRESAERKDRIAIERIIALDEAGLVDTVSANRISMCGVAPTTAMLACCRELGASRAECIRYQTSGDITGDFDEVVGYAGIIIC